MDLAWSDLPLLRGEGVLQGRHGRLESVPGLPDGDAQERPIVGDPERVDDHNARLLLDQLGKVAHTPDQQYFLLRVRMMYSIEQEHGSPAPSLVSTLRLCHCADILQGTAGIMLRP